MNTDVVITQSVANGFNIERRIASERERSDGYRTLLRAKVFFHINELQKFLDNDGFY